MEVRVDLRSDTVTMPSPEMRRAIYEAEVGDDVYGDDPSVNELEEKSAEMLGKEAGLFVTSGTQGNLVSMLAHCGRGDEVLVGDRSHIFSSEAGGASVLGGLFLYPIKTDRHGFLEPDVIRAATKPHDYHVPPTKLLCIENTHNQMSGQPLTTAQTEAMADAAREGGMNVHIDGARIFNAAVSLGVDVKELVAPADSATFCLSKGLSCPVGSVVVGSEDFINRARRWRKMLGAGMRQVGVIAAAGIYSLDNMIDRLAEDHAKRQETRPRTRRNRRHQRRPRQHPLQHRLLQHPPRHRPNHRPKSTRTRHPSKPRRPINAHGNPLRHLIRRHRLHVGGDARALPPSRRCGVDVLGFNRQCRSVPPTSTANDLRSASPLPTHPARKTDFPAISRADSRTA